VQGKISEADTPTIRLGATPSELISDPPPSPPTFMPDGLPATTLRINPEFGAGTKYTGLYTQWLDCIQWFGSTANLPSVL